MSSRRPPKRLVEASEALSSRDPVMRAMLERIGPADLRRGRPRRPHFAELARAISYQQLAGKAAAAIHGRFVALFDGDGPTPEAVLALPVDKLRGVGLSGSKTASIRDLAEKVVDGSVQLDRVGRSSPSAIRSAPTAVSRPGTAGARSRRSRPATSDGVRGQRATRRWYCSRISRACSASGVRPTRSRRASTFSGSSIGQGTTDEPSSVRTNCEP